MEQENVRNVTEFMITMFTMIWANPTAVKTLLAQFLEDLSLIPTLEEEELVENLPKKVTFLSQEHNLILFSSVVLLDINL